MGQAQATRAGWPLRVRLIALTVAVVTASVALATWLDYRRERAGQMRDLMDSLEDEAEGLRLARLRIPDDAAFAAYLDEFCQQMNDHVSPGHQIVVVDAEGHTSVHTHHHGGGKTQELSALPPGKEGVLRSNGRSVAWVRVTGPSGTAIVVAQYTDPVDEGLRLEVAIREITALVIIGGLVLVIYIGVERWVLGPLERLAQTAKAWGRGDFRLRAAPSGPPEFETLADKFNAMADDLDRRQQDERAQLDRARQIQRNLMPAAIPPIPGLSVVGLFRPAESVAGDLYDVFDLPGGRTAVFLIDVSGHGISAALLTGVVKMSMRRRLVEFRDPADAARAVNDDLLQCATTGSFVTACIGVWDVAQRTWTWCAAGHPGGLLVRGTAATVLPSTGALLGVLRDGGWKSATLTLQDGDRLLLFTDGILEAGRPDSPLGLDGVIQLAHTSPGASLEHLMRIVADRAVMQCSDTVCDDMTMVGLEVLPGTRGGQYYVI